MLHSASTTSRRRGPGGARTVDALTTTTTERPYGHRTVAYRTYDGNALFNQRPTTVHVESNLPIARRSHG